LIIGIVVQLVKSSGQTEISELDMTAAVKQDIVRFDITSTPSADLYLTIWGFDGLLCM
jgi:hypothetical protein